MIAQLRLLDPAISANDGSPERLILETVSAALANGTVSLNTLSGALDINSKTGDNLDRFLALFGFARQTSAQATGFVTFSANVAPINDIVIPANTQVFATVTSPANTTGSSTSIVYFNTQFQGTIAANSFPATVTVPIIAQVGGSSGNVAANTITSFGTAPVYGITSVNNPIPTNGGTDAETDAEFQTRFQNTVFRNLAGTEDQYLGLIASTKYSTQAQVIGPVSRYQEYLQVPPYDDTQAYLVSPTTSGSIGGNSVVSGNYTTALSTVPNSQFIYTNLPNFVTNGQQGTSTVFYREGIDWILNTTPTLKNQGDAYRFWNSALPGAENPILTSAPVIFQPNVTFSNVNTSGDPGVDQVQPEQVVFFEHAYLSSASRNNPNANVYNAVDIYVDGQNPVVATTNLALTTIPLVFNNVAGTYLTNTNYSRFGQPEINPQSGNWFFPLYSEPVIALPAQIIVSGLTASGVQSTAFYQLYDPTQPSNQWHYFLVQDNTTNYGTVRCRNGIEFNPFLNGNVNQGDNSGLALSQFVPGTNFTINGYTYDKNIVDLQALCESSKQITTDVLVHQAYPRYFKLDITVVYTTGATAASVNAQIQTAVQNYFASKTFGALIQTGSILQTIFAVPGVQDVRWSADLPYGPLSATNSNGVNRIVETDIYGNPLMTFLQMQTAVGVPNTPPPSFFNPNTGLYNSPFPFFLWTGTFTENPVFFNTDFFIGDDQLAYLCPNALPPIVAGGSSPDTLPGLIIRARAQGTWTRGPFSQNFNNNLPVQD